MSCFLESWMFFAMLIFSTILIIILLSVYIATWLLFKFHWRLQGPVKVPPTVPYMIPFIGSAISFAIDPRKFISASRYVSSLYASMILLVSADLCALQATKWTAGCSRHQDIEHDLVPTIQTREYCKDMEVQNHHNNAKCHNVYSENITWDDPQSSRHVHLGYLRD